MVYSPCLYHRLDTSFCWIAYFDCYMTFEIVVYHLKWCQMPLNKAPFSVLHTMHSYRSSLFICCCEEVFDGRPKVTQHLIGSQLGLIKQFRASWLLESKERHLLRQMQALSCPNRASGSFWRFLRCRLSTSPSPAGRAYREIALISEPVPLQKVS